MARDPAKKPYIIYYRDGAYQTIDLTKKDYEDLRDAFLKKSLASLSVGVMDTVELRSVLEYVPPKVEEEEETEEEEEPVYPHMSLEEQAFIWEQTVKAQAEKDKKKAEVDYN